MRVNSLHPAVQPVVRYRYNRMVAEVPSGKPEDVKI